jgi:hypothetical protein
MQDARDEVRAAEQAAATGAAAPAPDGAAAEARDAQSVLGEKQEYLQESQQAQQVSTCRSRSRHSR